MSNLIHAVARVRALESQLLTASAVEKLIAAPTFEDAFSLLSDFGFQEEVSYFEKNYDFEGVLEMGMFFSRNTLRSFGLHDIFSLLTIVWDIQNVKLFLKSFRNGDQENDVDHLFISYGSYSEKEIKDLIFHDGNVDGLRNMIQQAKKITSHLEMEKFVELTMLKRLKDKTCDSFLKEFLCRLETGLALRHDFSSLSTVELLKKYPRFESILLELKDEKEGNLQNALEVRLDEEMTKFLQEKSRGAIDGYAPIFSYFWRRERSARVIRSILLAKRAGVSLHNLKKEFHSFVF